MEITLGMDMTCARALRTWSRGTREALFPDPQTGTKGVTLMGILGVIAILAIVLLTVALMRLARSQ